MILKLGNQKKKSMKLKAGSLKKTDKISNLVDRLRKKRQRTQITNKKQKETSLDILWTFRV